MSSYKQMDEIHSETTAEKLFNLLAKGLFNELKEIAAHTNAADLLQ